VVGLRDLVDTEVSLDRESHQVLVSLDAPGVSIAVAFDPWVDDDVLPTALDELAKEPGHAHEIGPNASADLDLAADGGHASHILDQPKQAEKDLDEDATARPLSGHFGDSVRRPCWIQRTSPAEHWLSRSEVIRLPPSFELLARE